MLTLKSSPCTLGNISTVLKCQSKCRKMLSVSPHKGGVGKKALLANCLHDAGLVLGLIYGIRSIFKLRHTSRDLFVI